MLRLVAISCLVLSIFAAPYESDYPLERASGGIHQFYVGKRVAGDKLLWTGTGGLAIDFAKTVTMEVPFPQEGMTNDAEITKIVATTMLVSGNSQVTIQSGGVGQKSVNLKVVSNNAHKVSYKFEIYGK